MDETRRQIGRALDNIGIGPDEAPFRVLFTVPGARLRAYQPPDGPGPALLIVQAPFKRPYIWDLLPEVSVVRRCLAEGLRVYLLEWLQPGPEEDGFGLADYADRLPGAALAAITAEIHQDAIVVAGHSLGGTFAAIFAALNPGRVRGLALIDAGLAFGARGGPFARALAAFPHARLIRLWAGGPVPGSILNLLSVAAAPEVFQWQRMADLAACLTDPLALAVHARVERWTYDELAIPGQLFEDVAEMLYREDRFLRGTLSLGGRTVAIRHLRAPMIAVINPAGLVVPPDSILVGLAAAPRARFQVLTHEGGPGPGLQHLGPLVAPGAHQRLWPEIVSWLRSQVDQPKPRTAGRRGRRPEHG